MNIPQEISQVDHAPGLTAPSLMLAPLGEGLAALNARVAEEFLALAQVLQSNSASARQITAASHKATGVEANAHSSHSTDLLQQILADSQGMSEMVEISKEKMLGILSHVNAARAPLRRLTKMQSLLQTVGVLSRIEGGRITNTAVDLSGLSHDIDILAGEVQQHLNGIFDDSYSLSDMLQNGLRDLIRFGQQERAQSADLIRRTQAVLGPMIARSQALQAAAHSIDEQYTTFHRSTDKVVMSLQSEDIARQRVEHVAEAIRRVGATLDAGESVESCAGVLAVQRSQLVSTRDLLADSIQTIHSGLQTLGPRIQELVSQTVMLAQQSDEEGRSFAMAIDSGLATITSVFKQCSSSARAVAAVVYSVVPSVQKMMRGACALEEIEASIHLISLNATVKTAHLGGEGVAMGVIALELHSITRKSEGDTATVLQSLAAISDVLAKITSEQELSESSLMITAGSEHGLSSELAGLSQSIRTSSQEMTVGLNQVRQLAGPLCLELERGCELALRAQSLAELFDEQLRSFDQVFEQLGYSGDMASAATAGDQGADLAKLYSMESERKLHLEVFGGGAHTPQSPLPASDQVSSEFGDDVELF